MFFGLLHCFSTLACFSAALFWTIRLSSSLKYLILKLILMNSILIFINMTINYDEKFSRLDNSDLFGFCIGDQSL